MRSPDVKNAQARAYYLRNREQILAKAHAYYVGNREKAQAYYLRNRERICARTHAYQMERMRSDPAFRAHEQAKLRALGKRRSAAGRARQHQFKRVAERALRERVLAAYGGQCQPANARIGGVQRERHSRPLNRATDPRPVAQAKRTPALVPERQRWRFLLAARREGGPSHSPQALRQVLRRQGRRGEGARRNGGSVRQGQGRPRVLRDAQPEARRRGERQGLR
jgi:hypothetical protein